MGGVNCGCDGGVVRDGEAVLFMAWSPLNPSPGGSRGGSESPTPDFRHVPVLGGIPGQSRRGATRNLLCAASIPDWRRPYCRPCNPDCKTLFAR